MLNGTFNTFMFWFVIDIAGSRANLIITVALALRITYIILAFRVSGPVIRSLGVMNVTHIALLMYCGIFVMYGLMRNPWLAIIPEVLQNIIKALTEVAVILFFGEITPFRWAATVQGRYHSLCFVVIYCYIYRIYCNHVDVTSVTSFRMHALPPFTVTTVYRYPPSVSL
jgi:hypothetical protein